METNGIFDDVFDVFGQMIEDAKIDEMNKLQFPIELLEDYSDRKHA